MPNKKGFSLMEIVVVVLIIGILAWIAIPNWVNFMNQGAANAAEHNLITIYNAQKNYYFNNKNYCIDTTNPNPCDNLNDINSNLTLTITDPGNSNNDGYFTYKCTNTSGYLCTAKSISSNGPTLTLTLTTPIVLPGGTPTLNPSCTPGSGNYCPTG
jgi:prepilin-type N-terminal cleavage/methylation domain-containing protein